MCRNEKCGADIHSVRSPLHGFRFHDCRHHAITELCEAQANDSIIREIAGHVSPKMLAHYSHVRLDAKRKVIARLAALLALNTTMRAGEIRGLRWQVVDLMERTVMVGRSTTKTDAGERVIPLTARTGETAIRSRS